MHSVLVGFLLILPALNTQAQVQRVTFQLNRTASITFEQAPFKAVGKTFKYNESRELNVSKSLTTINGKPVFGTDGEMPRYILAKATLLLNGHSYHLQTDGMYNPWATAKMKREFIRLTQAGGSYKIQAVFSDGAGSYLAEWQVRNKVAKRTFLTADDELVTGFFQPGTSSK